jgi:diguanylate cyclase (GGDEF)-like protein
MKTANDRAPRGGTPAAPGPAVGLERFVHPALRRSADVLYRARAFIALLLGFDALLIAATLVCAINFLRGASPAYQLDGMLICSVLTGGISLLLALLRRRGNFAFCAIATVLLAEVAVSAGIVLSGGVAHSATAQLLVVPPLMAYFFLGLRWGNRTVLLSFAAVFLLAIAEPHGLRFSLADVSEQDQHIVQLMVCFIGISTVAALAWLYELTSMKLQQERDREHERVVALSNTDTLTGLANRRSFDAQLQRRVDAQAGAPRQGRYALCCLDLDGFKPINDRYGHDVGDEVLRAIAARLREAFAEEDLVGRHGGDEFMVLFELPQAAAGAVEQRMEQTARRLLALLGAPVETAVGPLQVSASLGFAVYPDEAATARSLREAADRAMYRAKAAGGSAWRRYAGAAAAAAGSSAVAAGASAAPMAEAAPRADRQPAGLGSPMPAAKGRTGRRPSDPWRAIDFFVHPALRLDLLKFHRARFLVMTLLLVCAVVGGTVMAMGVLPFSTASKRATIAVCGPLFLLTLLLLSVLRRSGDYRLCSRALVLTSGAFILIGIAISGGVGASASAPILLFIPVSAFFFGGLRWGAVSVAICLLAVALSAWLELSGVQLPNLVDASQETHYRFINSLIYIASVSGIALINELTASDLKRERDREKELVQQLARTDPLTGLANRSSFDDELKARIERHRAATQRAAFALCYLDLDGFKPINDRHGHDVGDEVLQAVSARLRAALHHSDCLGRQGGDEFTLILDAVTDATQIEFIAGRLAESIATPIATRVGEVRVAGSFGFAAFPEHGQDADALKRAADIAMYAAKRGRRGWSCYGPQMATDVPAPDGGDAAGAPQAHAVRQAAS